MSLAGWTLPQTPTGKSSPLPPPPWHYSGEMLAIDFTASPQGVAELCPPGFVPRGDGSCTFFFQDVASAAEHDPRIKADPAKGQYKEAFVVMHGSFQGKPAGRVPFIWVDSELSMLRGLVQGFPKKMAEIHQTRPVELGKGGAKKAKGERFVGHVTSLARRIVTTSIVIEESRTDFRGPSLSGLLHTRLWPSLDRHQPAVHEYATVDIDNVELGTVWRGKAAIEFGSSDFDEIDLLAPVTVGDGWVYSMAFTVVGGKTYPITAT
jgi:acetoacetate decarboxylase